MQFANKNPGADLQAIADAATDYATRHWQDWVVAVEVPEGGSLPGFFRFLQRARSGGEAFPLGEQLEFPSAS